MVNGNAQINLSFKQSQVDDVLKSMVVLDLNQGKIGAVSYNSSAPIQSRMSEIPFSVNPVSGEGGGISAVLSQLQGAKVMVASTKGTAIGSILTVERKQIKTDKETRTTSLLVIASESGEISSFDLSDVRSVKALEDGTRKDINEFANATASTRRLDAKTITVTSQGTGQREMVVSYTIAAPIWKTTYRVVLDKEGKPFFQGWAIVDNISEEDWQNVQLSLISGSPVSFIQQLQQPFYRYRPLVPMPEDLQLQPQIYEPQSSARSSAISGVVTDPSGALIPNTSITIRNELTGQTYSATSDSNGAFSSGDLPAGSYTVTAAAPGFQMMNVRNTPLGRNLNLRLEVGSANATVDVVSSQVAELMPRGLNFTTVLKMSPATRPGPRAGGFKVDGTSASENTYLIDGQEITTISDALTSGKVGVTAAAKGGEIGDLFEYRIEQPVTVMRDRSALIPIVQTKMDGERVAVYNESVRQDRPYSGVLLKNMTNLTLESGSMTVIDGDAYAGEALMERLKPKEQRLISYALDLGTHISVRSSADREPAKLIKAVDGVFQVHYFQGEQKTFEISNQTEHPKVLYIEYPIRTGWELSDDSPKPDYTTQSYYRFRVDLGALAEKEIKISLRRPLMDSYQLTSLTKVELELFVSRGYIKEATLAQLEKLLDIRLQMAQIDTKLESFDGEVASIEADQKRLRENIEALSKTAEAKTLIARYIAKAGEQETRLEEMEKERKALEAQKEQLSQQLANEIKSFEIK
jgi:hypothetical protein